MHERARGVVAIALAASTLTVLAGCGGGDGGGADNATNATNADVVDGGEPGGGESIAVTGREFAFDPAELTVAADTAFTVELTNAGVMEHDFTIEGEDADKILVSAGSEASGTFTLAAGTYKFFCSVPGHEAAGMVGTLSVE